LSCHLAICGFRSPFLYSLVAMGEHFLVLYSQLAFLINCFFFMLKKNSSDQSKTNYPPQKQIRVKQEVGNHKVSYIMFLSFTKNKQENKLAL
jgi:hypothetical protein